MSSFFSNTKLIANLFKPHSIVLVLIIFSYFAAYGLNVFLANTLGVDVYGQISLVMQILVFSTPFALLGTELSAMRFIPQYVENKQYNLISGFGRWSVQVFGWASMIILFVGAILLSYSMILDDLNILIFDKFHVIVYSFWLIPIFAFMVLQTSVLQALRNYYLASSFGGFALSVAIVMVASFLIAWLDNTWIGAYEKRFSMLICIGLASAIIIIAQYFAIRRNLPENIYTIKPKYNIKEWLKNSYQMMSSTIVFGALSAIDIMMIEFLSPVKTDVAYFAAIIVIVSSVVVFSAAVDMIVNPLISPAFEKKKMSHLQSILHIMNLFKMVPTTLISIAIVIWGKELLEHFGHGFSEAYPSLMVVLFGFVVGQCLTSSGPLLLYSGNQLLSFKISVAQLGAIILLDCALIPFWHLQGAVWSLSLSIIISSLIRTIYCHHRLNLRVFFFY